MEKYIELGKIIGPQGPAGVDGQNGKSAYQSAVEAGYSGTETAFNEALSSVPDHIADGNIHVTAEEKQAWSDSDVFIATYGTTTSAEIEAAYQAGKEVICFYNNGIVFKLAMAIPAGETYFFEGSLPAVEYDNNDKPSKVVWRKYYIECAYNVWQGATAKINGTVPSTHASTHATGGSDPITPADIGAATMTEVNAAIQTAIGNAIGGGY